MRTNTDVEMLTYLKARQSYYRNYYMRNRRKILERSRASYLRSKSKEEKTKRWIDVRRKKIQNDNFIVSFD